MISAVGCIAGCGYSSHMVNNDEWPEYSDHEVPREEFMEAVFRESGEAFLRLLGTIDKITKVAQVLSDKVIALDFGSSEKPQEFYDNVMALEKSISYAREGFVYYCQAMGIDLVLDTDPKDER
jgi:hypothetical protein